MRLQSSLRIKRQAVMRDTGRSWAITNGPLFLSVFFFVIGTMSLAADHNKFLHLELSKAISKPVAYDSQGYGYLLVPSSSSDGGQSVTLKVSLNPYPELISDFSVTVSLPALFEMTELSLFSAGLVVDRQDRLHIIWTTREGLTGYSAIETQRLRNGLTKPRWLNPVSQVEGGITLAQVRSWAGDIVCAPDGGVWLTWTTGRVSDLEVTVHLGTVRDGSWQSVELERGEGLYPATLLFSEDGDSFHVACGDTKGGTHYLEGRISELENGTWRFQRRHSGYRPALTETPDGILSVHESGNTLKYTFPKSESGRSYRLTALDSRFEWDTVHSPRLVLDSYRVPWLFFIDATRQHVFYSRWLGTKWSPVMNGFWLTRNTARFEDNHLSIDWLGVEPGVGALKSSIGLVIGHTSQFPTTRFDVIRVPSLKSDPATKILFLDLKEIQDMDGVEVQVNTAHKFSGNPVIAAGRSGEFDSQGAASLRVIKENTVFRAWYSGLFREPGSQWPKSGPVPMVRVGYAESDDGRSFEKKRLGLSSFGGNDDTNMVVGLPTTPIFRPIVPTGMHVDLLDPDPTRRYKFLTWTSTPPLRNRVGAATVQSDEEQTWRLWTSSDGLRWREASRGGIRFPAGMPSSFSPQSLFHDADERDPGRKYKAYGFIGLNNDRRGAGYGFSADASEWTADPRNPIFDAWARATPVVRSGKVEQIHDVVVWKYHQYYLAFYQYQRSGTNMTVELAMSRDGENFTYIQPGEEVVRRGAVGEWDSDMIAPSVPLVDVDEIKIYYSGYRFSKTKLIEGERACGLATIRMDGFTHLRLEGDQKKGIVTTIPVERGSATDLYINASCGQGSGLEVELIDPESGVFLTGYSREECTPLETDSLAYRVVWGDRRLKDVRNASFQIRFHFTKGRMSPNLYSFEFRQDR